MIKKIKNVKRYQMFIGMNDKEEMKQLISSEEFIKIIENICTRFKIEFTLGEVYGGSIDSNGKFICENSIVLSLVGLNKRQVFLLAEVLKKKFNQENILIIADNPDAFIVN